MAKKDTDDEKFDDDEDFGLPELHYEELDDDSDTPASTDSEEKEEVSEPPAESGEGSSEADPGFYEEESFDEFKEDTQVTSPSVFDSDDAPEEFAFGDTASSSFAKSTGTPDPMPSYYDEVSSVKAKSNFTKIVVIGTLLFISIAVVFVFMMDGDFGFGEKEQPVVVAPEPEPEPIVDTTYIEPVVQEPIPSGPQANTKTPGEIITLEQRTGKSYVIIGSFFDGDLAMDYAKVLAKNSKSPQIIPPFKDYRFYRVAIAEFDSFKDAEASAPSYAEEYGRDAWPLRY